MYKIIFVTYKIFQSLGILYNDIISLLNNMEVYNVCLSGLLYLADKKNVVLAVKIGPAVF